MKKELWGINVIGRPGTNAENDFAVGPNKAGDDVIIRVHDTELTGEEFLTLKDIAEGGAPGGGIAIEQDLDDPTFVPVANTYYKQKSGEKPEPVMTAFHVDDILSSGEKIHFDITKGDELLASLKAVPSEMFLQAEPVTEEDSYFEIVNVDAGSYIGVDSCRLLLLQDVSKTEGNVDSIIYAEEAGSLEGLVWVKGFQNLDADGNYTILDGIGNTRITNINDDQDHAWNGTIIGTLEEPPASQYVNGVIYFYDGEEYHAITGEGEPGTLDYNELENIPILNQETVVRSEYAPFEVNDMIGNGTKIHFDTTRPDELRTYLKSLEYTDMGNCVFFVVCRDEVLQPSQQFFILLGLYNEDQDAIVLAITDFSGGHNGATIFLTDDVYDEDTGITLHAGFQEGVLDENGDYTVTWLDHAMPVYQQLGRYADTWNGIWFSIQKEVTQYLPTPEDGQFCKHDGQIYKYSAEQPTIFDAFEIDDSLEDGARIHFDTTKEAELLAFLQSLSIPTDDSIILVKNTAFTFGIEAGYYGDVYSVSILDVGGSRQRYAVIYTSDVIPGLVETPGFQYGDNALDSNGNYALAYHYTVDVIDSSSEQWNGILIGKSVSDGKPELYDKVMLASEIEIPDDGAHLYQHEVQYSLQSGNSIVSFVNLNNEQITNKDKFAQQLSQPYFYGYGYSINSPNTFVFMTGTSDKVLSYGDLSGNIIMIIENISDFMQNIQSDELTDTVTEITPQE